MANVVMPEQIIKDTYGEIPDELIDVEKLLEEAGLSGAGKAPVLLHTEKDQSAAAKWTRSTADPCDSMIWAKRTWWTAWTAL